MDKNYELFFFQDIIEELKEKHDGEEKFDKLMEGIDENSVIEDMPFYKDYLSKFDIERVFNDYKLAAVEKELLSKDELFILFRLITASFSSSYEIIYDKQSNSIDLSVSVKSGEQTVTKNISELWSFQIIRLFEIYVNEQIEYIIKDFDPDEIEELEDERKLKLMVFEKKVRQLRNLQKTDEKLADLDELLNS